VGDRTAPAERTVSGTAVPQVRPTAADIVVVRTAGAAATHDPAAAVECQVWAGREAVGAAAECHAAEEGSAVEAADADRR